MKRVSVLRTLLASLAVVATIPACCREPWSKHPHASLPDRSCDVGSATHGHDVYIWECLDGRRIVVAQYSGEMFCSGAVEETAPCGSLTSLEKELAITPEQCRGARPGRDWRTR